LKSAALSRARDSWKWLKMVSRGSGAPHTSQLIYDADIIVPAGRKITCDIIDETSATHGVRVDGSVIKDDGVFIRKPWDISSALYLQSYSVAAQETFPQGMCFGQNGLKMYVVGKTSEKVHEYDLYGTLLKDGVINANAVNVNEVNVNEVNELTPTHGVIVDGSKIKDGCSALRMYLTASETVRQTHEGGTRAGGDGAWLYINYSFPFNMLNLATQGSSVRVRFNYTWNTLAENHSWELQKNGVLVGSSHVGEAAGEKTGDVDGIVDGDIVSVRIGAYGTGYTTTASNISLRYDMGLVP